MLRRWGTGWIVALWFLESAVATEYTRVYEFDPIVVTATRVKARRSETGRALGVIDSLALHSGAPLADLLAQTPSVDLKARGGHGVQSDLGIRGASYSQVLVLVDGQRMNDPQTGHHQLNLPLASSSLERVEILPGHSSAQYGADALGGVVNLCTRPWFERLRVSGGWASGTFGLQRSQASLEGGTKRACGALHWVREQGDGYREDTEFKATTLSALGGLRMSGAALHGTGGIQTKAFGANQFYGPAPSWEEVEVRFGSLRAEVPLSPGWSLEPKAWVRMHRDSFVYDRNRPLAYANKHQTRVLGGELLTVFEDNPARRWVLGVGGVEERIESNRLGSHRREGVHAFVQEEEDMGRLRTTLALRGDDYSAWGTVLSPSLALAYRLPPALFFRGAFGRAFRIPSYTELFYYDPANRGNAALLPEQSWNAELGAEAGRPRWSLSLTTFFRESENLIDWTKPAANPSEPWQVTNLRRDRLWGAESELSLSPLSWLGVRASDLEIFSRTRVPDGVLSKYVYSHPQRIRQGRVTLFSMAEIGIRYALREGEAKGYTVMDGGLRQRVAFGKHLGATLSISGQNLTNVAYQDFQGIPLEPRSGTLGVMVEAKR